MIQELATKFSYESNDLQTCSEVKDLNQMICDTRSEVPI